MPVTSKLIIEPVGSANMTYSGRYVPTTAPEDEEEAAANQEAMRPKIEGYNVAPPEEPAAPTGTDLMSQYGITN